MFNFSSYLRFKSFFILLLILNVPSWVQAQETRDTFQQSHTFSGSVGLTNNGFSIVPTFSLNSPAIITLLSWKKSNFSIDPDIRLTPDGKKGSILLWFRYHIVNTRRFTFRMGVHPAMNLQRKVITDNGEAREITQMQRFLAWELNPNVVLGKKISTGIYYLQGNALQNYGTQTVHFVNFYTTFQDLPLSEKFRLAFTPAFYFLTVDGHPGTYFTATAGISNTDWPISLQAAINQTIQSEVPGNENFLWNVSLNYRFNKVYYRKHIK